MKKTTLFLVLLAFMSVYESYAQVCGTVSNKAPDWFFDTSLTKSHQNNRNENRTFTLNVFFHIVRDASGNGMPNSIINESLTTLNTHYSNTGISFRLLGFEEIRNTEIYNNANNRFNELISINPHLDAIDIYVLGMSTIWQVLIGNEIFNINGQADGIISKALVIKGDKVNSSVLSHEVGHCLGLYHTHHGTFTEGGDVNECPELVDGSNATTCGDYIQDTPADPNIWSECNYVGNVRDANDDIYMPDASNYMSYSGENCWSNFTIQQINRMKDAIVLSRTLNNTIYRFISGPSHICDQATYTITNFPPGASVEWSTCRHFSIISGQGTNTVTIQRDFTGYSDIGRITATITIGGSVLTIHKTGVEMGTRTPSFEMYDSQGLYTVLPPYYTGTQYRVVATFQGVMNIPDNDILWTITPPLTSGLLPWSDVGKSIPFMASETGDYNISLKYYNSNECGWSTTVSKNLNFRNRSSGIILQPNPALDYVIIQFKETDSETNLSKETELPKKTMPYQIQLWNSLGLVKQVQTDQTEYQLDLSGLSPGFYYVHVIKDGETYRQQLIVQ